MRWTAVKIGEHCTVTSSKRFHLSERSESGVPFYCSKEIIQKCKGEVITECDYIREDFYKEVAAKYGVPQAGDLLVTTRGTIGIPYIYSDDDHFYFADGNLTWLKEFDNKLSARYLYYWFLTNEGKKKIEAIAKGTAQKAVPIAGIKTLELSIPPLDIQRRIADILSAYDDLIENNQKQIKLLEEAAQRLYKEWFVDLRFPGYEDVTVVDGVPEGWMKSTVGSICQLRKETLTPDKIPSGVPYIGLEHMPRKDICLAEWGDSSEVSSNKFAYYEDDILFGKIRPYFHKVGFALNCGVASTDSIVMTANRELWSLLLMTVSSDTFVDYSYQNCKEGAKMPRADWHQMCQYKVLIATAEIMRCFNNRVEQITRKIKALALQNRLLAEARDRLLPKLMNGEIEV